MTNRMPIVIELGEVEQQVFDKIIVGLINDLSRDFHKLAGLVEGIFGHRMPNATFRDGGVIPQCPEAIQTVEFLEVVNDTIVAFLRLYDIHYIGPLSGKVNSISGR